MGNRSLVVGLGAAARERWRVCRRRGFTLLEMLVVVAIISLLVMVMLPFLDGAREHGYNAQCQGNLRRLGDMIHARGAERGMQLPVPEGWIGVVAGGATGELLRCPKGYYKGGVGGISTTTGNVEEIRPPISTVFNDLESNTRIRAFLERNYYVLPAAIEVDISEPGYYENNYDRTKKTIPAGTVVASVFTHFDPIGNQGATSSGSITVPGEIIGIICTSKALDKSDPVLAVPGTRYSTGQSSRGFESGAEKVTFEPDRRTFTIHQYRSTFPGEETRILTIPGGEASYGMSNLVNEDTPRPSQIMLVEYDKQVVDIDGQAPDDAFRLHVQPRHFGRANVLFVGGAVKLIAPDELDPNRSPNLWREHAEFK